MEIVAILPARFASTRLPGKPLLSDTGRPLIQHVVEAARKAKRLDRVIVATDDPRIADAVRRFGGEVTLTRADHSTGTDRVAEVAARLPEAGIIVNLQGDEPEISGEALDLVVSVLEADPEAPMATLATPIRSEAVYRDPSCVKVVATQTGRALYFSRSPIPCYRDGDLPTDGHTLAMLHLGLYAYRRDFLLRLATLPPRRSNRPRSSSSSGCSKPDCRSHSASSMSRASGSTRPRTTAGSSSAGETRRPRTRPGPAP